MILLGWLRRVARTRQLSRRFPLSTLYRGVDVSDDSAIGDYTVLFRGVALFSSTVGRHSYLQENTRVYNAAVGPFCSIASDVTVGLAAHATTMVSTSPVFYDNTQPLPRFFTRDRKFTATLPRTTIEADVWIGQGAMIRAGVRIGVGAVIGAGAIVTKDIAPYQIAAGNPCRVIRPRFPTDLAARLLESKWWELDAATLDRLADRFADPDAMLAELSKGPGLP